MDWLHGGLAGGLCNLHGAWAVLITSASATSCTAAALLTLLLGFLRSYAGDDNPGDTW